MSPKGTISNCEKLTFGSVLPLKHWHSISCLNGCCSKSEDKSEEMKIGYYVACKNCDICGKNVGKKYCVVCQQLFCFHCLDFHNKINVAMLHEVVDFDTPRYTDALKKVRYKVCTSHGQDIDHHCASCEAFICSKCFIQKHQSHDILTIESKVEDYKETIESLIEQFQNALDKNIKNLEIFDKNEISLDKEESSIISQINANTDYVKNRLDKYSKILINRVTNLYTELKTERDNFYNSNVEKQESMKSNIKLLKKTLEELNVASVTEAQTYSTDAPNWEAFKSKCDSVDSILPDSIYSKKTLPETLLEATNVVYELISTVNI
ncbi:hypothetical protein HELRODRAFT_190260 [Helobdella robusta]|uniref:B box-type domain-containing protein n=1 Tax=Helobdella robusta TaxID=6412 RepID=T1FRT9_HELRO|nr:hypothetical protein HELRODRAFT_190260 [Helobdella robusta]ESO10988.1 hypothetical protein HELRODRAFT_190260 [Helobdella robusta]